jgi:hypothetical protein
MTTSVEASPNDKRLRTTIIGSVVGALAGVLAAMFYIRAKGSSGTAQPRRVHPSTLIGIGMTALNLLRQIANLGEK